MFLNVQALVSLTIDVIVVGGDSRRWKIRKIITDIYSIFYVKQVAIYFNEL